MGETKEGLVDTRAMTPEDYIKRAEPFLVGNGFFLNGRLAEELNSTATSPMYFRLTIVDTQPAIKSHSPVELIAFN